MQIQSCFGFLLMIINRVISIFYKSLMITVCRSACVSLSICIVCIVFHRQYDSGVTKYRHCPSIIIISYLILSDISYLTVDIIRYDITSCPQYFIRKPLFSLFQSWIRLDTWIHLHFTTPCFPCPYHKRVLVWMFGFLIMIMVRGENHS